MVTELGLAGYELVAYALVHQFSMKSKAGMYTGGVPYLASWLSCSLETARKYLHQLEEKGLILAKRGTNDGVPYCYYQVIDNQIPKILRDTPKDLLGDTQNSGGRIPKKIGVEYKDEYKIESNNTPTPFDFGKALRGIGIYPTLVDEWLKVRKVKKAVNTETAFKAIEKEIAEAERNGHTPDECINLAVVKSWCGFKWAWMQNELNNSRQMQTTNKTRTVSLEELRNR